MTRFEGMVASGEDSQLNSNPNNVKKRTFTSPILGSELQRGSYTGRDPTDKYVRTATENQDENSRSVSALSFSL